MEGGMEFKIGRNVFLDGIQKTLGIVEKKTTLPILNNVLIRASREGIRVVATDREISLLADYEAQVSQEGDVTLSARKLYEMIRETQGEIIHFHRDDQYLVTLTSQKAIYKIPGIPADDFPSVVISEDISFFKMRALMLKDMIAKTAFSMSVDEVRKNLNGVFFESDAEKPGVLRAVATDGHRLATASAYSGDKDFWKLEKGVIVPRKGVLEIRKLLEGETGDISIGVQQGMCVVKTDVTILKVSLIDADFPDYRRVIPVDKGLVVQFEKEAALHALRRMSVISSDRYSGVIVTLKENQIILNSTNPDVGEANDELEVVYSGNELEVGYNVNYLIDAIEVIDEKRAIFEMRPGMKPGVIKSIDNVNHFSIIMPLRL
jgi:DNA polymerase-3 subunit beta